MSSVTSWLTRCPTPVLGWLLYGYCALGLLVLCTCAVPQVVELLLGGVAVSLSLVFIIRLHRET